jgi:hypothetical protein
MRARIEPFAQAPGRLRNGVRRDDAADVETEFAGARAELVEKGRLQKSRSA